MFKRALVIFLLLLIAGWAYVEFGGLPDPLPKSSQSRQWLKSGPEDSSYFDVSLVDSTRPTPANGDYAGSDQRVLKTRIWHPKRLDLPHPLVIYSHGFMSMRSGGSYLAEHLASHGYIVAAMDYPLSHFGAPGGPSVNDVANQLGDIRFLLDQFLSWNQQRGHQFFAAVDANRIALVGFSLGGLTSTLAGYHPQLGDSRVKAVVSIAGPSYGLPHAFFTGRQLPFMMIAAPDDAMVNYQRNAADIPQRVPGAVLVRMENASHTGFTALSRYLRWLDNPDWLGCNQLRSELAQSNNPAWQDTMGEGLGGIQAPTDLCEQQDFAKAMNPVRQQWLTTLAVYAFLESQFALGVGRQQDAEHFLLKVLPEEMAEIMVNR
ncbi:Alpha/beta hydrolase family [Spongiibacter sp. IMCC21906]|uniref:alpha/beta hydrolase family protein n=1 Tax=Spongiibacter sp. IMCC21906 TaxID=1620392 RepID=UPI00062E07B5|nr:alpha/beta fold hydrolase [Spongiibacter sp. IMCC21906]AKH68328.1 Alpha/beta hydrolase family [Spongiibacter sp. IMCC21906]